MTITALMSTTPSTLLSRASEATEGLGPDRDGDADNKSAGISNNVAVSPAAPHGMGAAVDIRS
jgi:hypothetical protein